MDIIKDNKITKKISDRAVISILTASVLIFILGIRYRKRIKSSLLSKFDNEFLSNLLENKEERKLRYLLQIHPKYRNTFSNLIKDIERMGYEVYPTSAYRDFEKQKRLYESGQTTTPYSMHNFGLAMDFVLKKNGKIIADMKTPKSEWEKTGVPDLIKNKYHLTWGGDFKGYYDPVHAGLDGKYDVKKLVAEYNKKNFISDNIPNKYKDYSSDIKFVQV
ncbi:MAG: M15 family metallopeptidase [Candidatus Aenigmatarchaeota archaeon]